MNAIEQHRLLTQAKLQLVGTIVSTNREKDLIVLKNVPRCTYLVVDRLQARVLQRFRHSATVSDIVPQLIRDRQSPALRDLYELVIKAIDRKFLVEKPDEDPPIQAMEWTVRIGEKFASFLGTILIIFGFIALFFRNYLLGGIPFPEYWWQVALGILPMTVAFSLGYLLAACVLSGHECEVYSPRFHWRTIFPHLRFDLLDSIMSGRQCQISISIMRLAPIFLLMGCTALSFPAFTYMTCLGAFYFTKPINSPMVDLLRALYGNIRLSTREDFLFWMNRKPWQLFRAKMKYADRRFQFLHAVYTLSWLCTLYVFHAQILDLEPEQLLREIFSNTYSRLVLHISLWLVAIVFILVVLLNLIIIIRYGIRKLTTSTLWQRMLTRVPKASEINRLHVMELLNQCLLFQELKPEVREIIAEKLLIAESNPGNYITKKGDHPDYFYIIFAGKVEVCKPLLSGRLERISILGPGEAFGEISLLRNIPRTHTVRALTKSIILALSKEDFQQHIVRNLGSEKVIEIQQKRAFLKRIPLCAKWSPANIELFAEKSVIEEYEKDEKVLARGQENQFFHIVHESRFRVARQGKTLTTLTIGDFFGEISLLQGSVTTADVICLEGGKLLSLHRTEFLRILGWDYQLAIQFEAIASKRLNKNIFPLSEGNFESVNLR